MGKKAVFICGAFCAIVLVYFIPLAIKKIKIENLIKDLHSTEPEIQGRSIAQLAEFGTEIVPRLLEELKNLPQIEETQAWYLNDDWDDYKIKGGYEFVLIKALLTIGEPSIPILIRGLSKDDLRLESIAICTMVFFYTKSSDIVLNDEILFGNSYLQHRDQVDDCFYLITVKKNRTNISLIGEVKYQKDQGVMSVEKESASIIPILMNLVKPELRPSEVGSYYNLGSERIHKNERILPSKLVVKEAIDAINRLRQ